MGGGVCKVCIVDDGVSTVSGSSRFPFIHTMHQRGVVFVNYTK